MIGHLRGSLLAKKPYQIVLDVAGVGYELRVPYYTSQLPAIGKELALDAVDAGVGGEGDSHRSRHRRHC